MGNAHRRLGAVDVLAASAAGPVDIDPQIRRIDVDVDVVVHFGRNKYRCERCVTPVPGIERGFPHEPVYTGLGAQPAVGEFAGNQDRRTFDSGNLAGGRLNDLRREIMRLGPAQIHPQEHVRPVLGFGATGAGLNVEERVAVIELTTEHAAKFELLDLLFEALEIGHERIQRVAIVLFHYEFQQAARICKASCQRIQGCDNPLELRPFLAEGLGTIGFVPDIGLFELALDLGQAFRLGVVVKDTPLTRSRVP